VHLDYNFTKVGFVLHRMYIGESGVHKGVWNTKHRISEKHTSFFSQYEHLLFISIVPINISILLPISVKSFIEQEK